MRRERATFRKALLLCASLILGATCGGGGSSYDDELAKFQDAARQRIDGFSESTGSAFVQFLASTSSSDFITEFVEEHEPAIRGVHTQLCEEVVELAKNAGSGDTKVKRIEPVLDGVTRTLQDRLEFAVLRSALGRPQRERDMLLSRLPLKGQTASGEVSGIEALRSVGLVDGEGHLVEPSPGTPEYNRYDDWNDADGAFRGQVIALSGRRVLCDY